MQEATEIIKTSKANELAELQSKVDDVVAKSVHGNAEELNEEMCRVGDKFKDLLDALDSKCRKFQRALESYETLTGLCLLFTMS